MLLANLSAKLCASSGKLQWHSILKRETKLSSTLNPIQKVFGSPALAVRQCVCLLAYCTGARSSFLEEASSHTVSMVWHKQTEPNSTSSSRALVHSKGSILSPIILLCPNIAYAQVQYKLQNVCEYTDHQCIPRTILLCQLRDNQCCYGQCLLACDQRQAPPISLPLICKDLHVHLRCIALDWSILINHQIKKDTGTNLPLSRDWRLKRCLKRGDDKDEANIALILWNLSACMTSMQ